MEIRRSAGLERTRPIRISIEQNRRVDRYEYRCPYSSKKDNGFVSRGHGNVDNGRYPKAQGRFWRQILGRKPFILEVDGRRFAVSVSAMPHAGVDGAPYLANVSGRSGDYGYGPNYDAISGNGMDGHFDLYFLNGRRHKDGQIDPQHQMGVLLAGGLQ